ncbi:phosphoribosyl-ATP diphosphatase [Flavobacteriaceae bacterium]|nr:phosphoribosyl-ATP diphosphatase [Flavobacteriaceae bacterium]
MTKLSVSKFNLSDLFSIVESKKHQNDIANSYTAKMLNAGSEKIARKVCEEATEVALASIEGDGHKNGKQQIINEASDLIYHLFILMASRGVALDDILLELEKRIKK